MQMTSRERITRMYDHAEADRIPIWDNPWTATIERWQNEGMPKDVDYIDFFDLDHIAGISTDNSPMFPAEVVEETDEYIIHTTNWGATIKDWKHAASTPEFLDFTIIDRDAWNHAKARMKPTPNRIDWAYLKQHYPSWRENHSWIEGHLWFGFDTAHSWAVGTERILIALIEDPQWCMDIFAHQLDLSIALLEMVWDKGYTFDAVCWADDMGYKQNQFFSLNTYREILKPFHQRAIEWAHSKGIKTQLHSCGDINPFVPELVKIGLDALNPLEVKAGMDPIILKQQYGEKLLFQGGINAVLWDDFDAISAEMKRVIPVLKESGGYIFSSDHSVPSSVSLENFRRIVQLAKELGSYE